jgi:flavin-dependent dehydrogenase
MVAARTYVRGDRLDAHSYRIFFLQHLLPRYAWIFSVASGLYNVGVGLQRSALRKKGIKLKRVLDDFLSSPQAHRVMGSCRPVEPVRAHPLRTAGPRIGPLVAERMLTMGDAAALINPLSGEGIGPALESGLLAAEQVRRAFQEGDFSQGRLSPYSLEIQKRYGADYRAGSILRALMNSPQLMNAGARLAKGEPEFALLLAKAALSQSASQLLGPSTLLKSTLYWPPRAILRALKGANGRLRR